MKKTLLFSLASCLLAIPSVAAVKPNIIIVMTDDQGYGDLSLTGNKLIKTPAIDSLAKDGAWLTRFYVSPVCTPTRSALMTGRYPQRTRAYDTYVGRAMMEPEEVTIAERLSEAGYSTGIFGKWHLGDCYPMRPSEQGFDEVLVHNGGGLCQPADPIANDNRYTNPVLAHNNTEKQFTGYCTDVYFDHAMKFMDAAKQANKPFFCYLATNAPHGPFHDVPEKNYLHFKGKAKDDKQARIFAMIENVEDNMAKLLKYLDAKKLTENTIVIFLTDNGPNGKRFVGPFRGSKGSVVEGGVRTPLLVRWPAKIKPGHRNNTNAAHIDLHPTLLEAAGVKPSKALDGTSVLPLLTGETPESFPTDRAMIFQWHRGIPAKYQKFCVVAGDWKLTSPKSAVVGPAKMALYNIASDPGENTDLSQKHPERKKQLIANYDAWFESISNTRKDTFAPPRIVIGTPHETHTRFTKQDWLRAGEKGWGKQGKWLVQAKEKKSYTAKIYLSKAGDELPIIVHAGDQKFSSTIPAGTKEHSFSGLDIKQGNFELQVTTKDGKPVPNIHQLHLIQ